MAMKETKVGRKVFRTPSQWRQLIASYEASGLSQERFCAQHKLALSTFCNWRAKLRSSHLPADAEQGGLGSFLEVLAPSRASGWDMELELAPGVVLRLRRG